MLLKLHHWIPTTCFVFRQVAVCLHVFFVCSAVYEEIMVWVIDDKKKKKKQHILAYNHLMCMKENSWIRKFMERASIEITLLSFKAFCLWITSDTSNNQLVWPVPVCNFKDVSVISGKHGTLHQMLWLRSNYSSASFGAKKCVSGCWQYFLESFLHLLLQPSASFSRHVAPSCNVTAPTVRRLVNITSINGSTRLKSTSMHYGNALAHDVQMQTHLIMWELHLSSLHPDDE